MKPTSFSAFSRRILVTCAVSIAALHPLARGNSNESASGTFLAHKGRPTAFIVVGTASSPTVQFAAKELQRYLKELSYAELPIATEGEVPAGNPVIVVGSPKDNPLSALAERRRLVNFSTLKPEGFIVKTVDLNGKPALIVGGNDDAGTMYAAYEFLERLGIVFQITHDIIPERKPDLALPALNVRIEPVAEYRGVMVEHGFGSWNLGLQDYIRLIDQMAKLKFNTLQFTFGMGSPFLKFSYKGKVGELLTTPETGYTAWGQASRSWGKSPHTTTGTADDIRVGREVFPETYIGGPEFASVHSPEEAYRVGGKFLHALIRHAHERHVQVTILTQELSFVPPNLADVPPEARVHDEFMYQRYCGVALSPGDPATLGIWEAAMNAMIEQYPDADSYGFWTTEHSPDMRDARIQKILKEHADVRARFLTADEILRRGNAMVRSSDQIDSDFLQVYLAGQLVERVQKSHPAAQLNVMTLFRGYKLPVLDTVLPKNVWLGNMEECATTGPVMSFYGGMPGRKLFVIPRISDDGDEFHMQLNATEYDDDQIITGTARYHLSGIVGQLIHPRNSEYNIRYLAEGGWNAQIQPSSFYESYLSRLYGPAALDPLMRAFSILEKNEKAMVYWGRSEIFMAFKDFSALPELRTNVNYRSNPLTVSLEGSERINEAADERAIKGMPKLERSELVRSIGATWGTGPFWKWRRASIGAQHADDLAKTKSQFYQDQADQCRRALALLRLARASVLPGSREELEYVIYKTESFADYLDICRTCSDAEVTLDRAWLGLFDRDYMEFRMRLEQCKVMIDRADRLARASAGQMIAYGDDPTEKYLLLRYNRNVIASIERARSYVARVIAFSEEKSP